MDRKRKPTAAAGLIQSSPPKNKRRDDNQRTKTASYQKKTTNSTSNKICTNKNKLKLLVIHGRPPSVSISLLSTAVEEEEEEKDDTLVTFPKPKLGCLVASCHNLVLAAKDKFCDLEELALFDPSTKFTMTLPQPPHPPLPPQHQWTVKLHGLGLVPNSDDDDYKVIRMVEERAAGYKGHREVELFSLKTKIWKQIPYPHDVDFVVGAPIFINGFNYWIAITPPSNEELVIISFDFAKESFPSALIPWPPNEAYKIIDDDDCPELYDFLLAEYEGSLALVVYEKYSKQIELWVWDFDNRSWSSVGVWVVGVDVFKPLAFLNNRLFYFEASNGGELGIFDTSTQKFKNNHGLCAVDPLPLRVFPLLTRTP